MASLTYQKLGTHAINDAILTRYAFVKYKKEKEFTYTFENFFHPFVGELIRKLNRDSLPGLLDPVFHESLSEAVANPPPFDTLFTNFQDFYQKPAESRRVKVEGFPKEIDVREGGPYANYNWELLFHIPLMIAVHLSKNQRFAEAQRWFHFIFDPTSTDTSVDPPMRYWRFLRFRQISEVNQIDELLELLSKPEEECTPAETALKAQVLAGYMDIQNKPFRPHAVARMRHLAYQYQVVMKYLDNLIDWGDSLFRQDTIESLNEATQRYVLAANLLGPRPQRVPPSGTIRPKTFAQLQAQGLDEMGNALVELEGKFPFNHGLPQVQGAGDEAAGPLFGIGRTLYFCIPRNEKLLAYWDKVADRLFKIRNCLNIEGVFRQLALFDPPIDPGMLVKAAAAGIDLGSIISGLNQPVGPQRCLFWIQKAAELAAEVRSLGGALLAAVEKGDAERLALLRQSQAVKIRQLQAEVRFLQWKQAQEATETLRRSRDSVLERYSHYLRLLGQTPDRKNAPEQVALDRREMTAENFAEAFDALVGQYDKAVSRKEPEKAKLAGDSSPKAQSGASGVGKLFLTLNEHADLNILFPLAKDDQLISYGLRQLAPVLGLIPQFPVHIQFWGLGGEIQFGGEQLAKGAAIAADVLDQLSAVEEHDATSAAKTASFERRSDEWVFSANLAARELMQIGRQIIGSLIAEQVAQHEYGVIQQQIENAQEVDRFLQEKFSNAELYAWMQGETSRLYYEYYRFAFDTARKAERTMKQELMRPELDGTDFIKFNYWDGGRKGLLSGEALYLDVQRLELAYQENNKREYELTKHISLRQLDPASLLALKATGSCEVRVPEWLFDLDGPGHYLRRLKNVSLSIPSAAGPHTSVSCTLALLKSTIRKSPLGGEYARQGSEDDRFVDIYGSIQSIVTSTGQNDGGLFETDLQDERFLPFEGAGAESTWKLELPADFRQFDYNTISDVILHLRYTARQGGAGLRGLATADLAERVAEANSSGLAMLLSLSQDFPAEWQQFVAGAGNFAAVVKREHFPYFTLGKDIELNSLRVYNLTDGTLNSQAPAGIDLGALTEQLGEEGEFDLTLAESGVLVRQAKANVFAVLRYSLE
jgi:hypothetical protein